jgi:hypothetical protein
VTTATGGLIYAHTRHATSRAGDPCPHDHVLLANVVEMKDAKGGWKAADTTVWRDHLHAATMLGRAAAARRAVQLGYAIEADPGPSGRLGHWRIAGIPDEVLAMHSKRAAEITAACQQAGQDGHRARAVAARTTRSAKQHRSEGELVSRWRGELAEVGWPIDRLAATVDEAARQRTPLPTLSLKGVRRWVAQVTDPDGELARRKVFARRDVIVQIAPLVYGRDPRLVEALADRVLADPEVIPLVGVAGARERPHALASVLATESTVAASLGRQVVHTDGPVVPAGTVEEATVVAEERIGAQLSAEQRAAAQAICTSGRGAELVVGVAGAGKTTMLAVVADAYRRAGCQVLGTATSGQAARTLGGDAHLDRSSTLASLLWRLDHHLVSLDDHTVMILDEAGLTDDAGLARLAAHLEADGGKLVVVGDHRQLSAVGPGGALASLVARHPDAVHHLDHNHRQTDPGERAALADLRDGDVGRAVAWYANHDRIHPVGDRDAALQATVDAWAADVAAGANTALVAWRRTNVAELNNRARAWMADSGRLTGPEVVTDDGAAYRPGDHVIALAPDRAAGLVTSQRATVTAADPATGSVTVRIADDRVVTLAGDQLGADRLGHGYATTVHRCQGATTDRAHLYADGGGRELAYVAMSRARHHTNIWLVADDRDQAAQDLGRDWSRRASPTWALDTGLPDLTDLTSDAVASLSDADKQRLAAIACAQAQAVSRAATPTRAQPPADLEESRAAVESHRVV